jgi:manganese/zinc/iron transport system permease protein
VIALLVIPAAAARFWTHRLSRMLIAAAIIGAASCYIGTLASAVVPNLPSGAIIVLASSVAFALSMVFGPAGGLLKRYHDHQYLRKVTSRQNVLRALFEILEPEVGDRGVPQRISTVGFSDLLAKRSWSAKELRRELRQCQREGLVVRIGEGKWRPTTAGLTEARRVARQHRLWELYLITHADIAPNQVDRSADLIEHVIGEEITAELETMLSNGATHVPSSPHSTQEKGGAVNA